MGEGLLLLFDAGLSSGQSQPPPHGARPVHTSSSLGLTITKLEATPDHEAGSILQEIDWENGVRSFYFHDPAGNVLEIADGDLWPES